MEFTFAPPPQEPIRVFPLPVWLVCSSFGGAIRMQCCSLRRVYCADATPLTGKFRGTMYAVSGKDALGQIILLASRCMGAMRVTKAGHGSRPTLLSPIG